MLKSLPLLRRAHVALSFVGHMYIHSSWPASRSVPSAIAIPWTKVSDRLGLPPILTYADTVLWNWKLVDSTQGITASYVYFSSDWIGADISQQECRDQYDLYELVVGTRLLPSLPPLRITRSANPSLDGFNPRRILLLRRARAPSNRLSPHAHRQSHRSTHGSPRASDERILWREWSIEHYPRSILLGYSTVV